MCENEKLLYLDNAATTPVLPEVKKVMIDYIADNYGNPSSLYRLGRMNRLAVEEARSVIADTINAKTDEIFFTSGGTESDNWVIESAMAGKKQKTRDCHNAGNNKNTNCKGHIIVSSIEHPAVINKCRQLEKRGYDVDYIKVLPSGIVSINALVAAIRYDTGLISVMLVNNEIGTIQPLRCICNIAAEYGIPVHTDAVAAYGHIPVDVNQLGVDYLSASAHKIGAAKGVGFLYARNGNIEPFICGGGQEKGKRSGTENVPGIIGFSTAAVISRERLEQRIKEELNTRQYISGRILREIEASVLNGDNKNRISGNMNFSFNGVNGGELVVMLDRDGICVSAGSACHGNTGGPSHVLKAIGLSDKAAQSAIRLTLNEGLTKKECDYIVECIKKNVRELRNAAFP